MSFGFGVGDFLAVLQLASKVRKAFVDAPDQFKAISDEVRNLSRVLQDLDDVLSARYLTASQQETLSELIEGCMNVLRDIDKLTTKYSSLEGRVRGFRGKSKKVWSRLRWEPPDAAELRGRVTSNISFIIAFNGNLSVNYSRETLQGVNKLVKRHDDRERQYIEEWITTLDFAAQQTDCIGQCQQGTGQWLLKSRQFMNLLNGASQTLFCPGAPGVGKTIISSLVIDHVWRTLGSQENVGIAYIYCNYKRRSELTLREFFASLLVQLLRTLPDLPESIRQLHRQHIPLKTGLSVEELKISLQSAAAGYSRLFIIIDALDECTNEDGTRRKLLDEIMSLQSQFDVAFFATSRPLHDVTRHFEGKSRLQIRASDEDVNTYLIGQMARLPECVLRQPELQQLVRTEIIKAIDGMFLLARLHLDSLTDKTTPKAVKRALQQLPRGFDALDSAYKDAIDRINDQKPGFRDLARKILLWITCAKRQLTVSELQHALAVEPGENSLDEDNIPDVGMITSVCAGLVIRDQEADVCRLVHYTTQEYFERNPICSVVDAHTEIASTCLTYLSHDVVMSRRNGGLATTWDEYRNRLKTLSLFEYSSLNWATHGKQADIQAIMKVAMRFLMSPQKVNCVDQVLLSDRFEYHSKPGSVNITGAHLAAKLGFVPLLSHLLSAGLPLNQADDEGLTSLMYACYRGHEEVVKLLLGIGVPADQVDCWGLTPLAAAAQHGHTSVVEVLLDSGVFINPHDNYGRTPLIWACRNGHAKVAQLLLQAGAPPDARDWYGETALTWSSSEGNNYLVRILLDWNADIELKDRDGRTALWWAVCLGQEQVMRLLLKRGAIVNCIDKYGQSPLLRIARQGDETITRILLSEGLDPNHVDQNNATALWWAADAGKNDIVKIMLDQKVDVNVQDKQHQSALMRAAIEGHSTVAQTLIDRHFTDVNIGNGDDRSVLSWACQKGAIRIVRCLLARPDIQIDSKDNWNRSPLWYAVSWARVDVAKLLLQSSEVDIYGKDVFGLSPFDCAKDGGFDSLITLMKQKSI